MPLEFHNNAIVLSGETGTKLKSSILEDYYYQWWKITSGGLRRHHMFDTSIVEMNAATGEIYIQDTKETILGSAGHAMQLKNSQRWYKRNLKVICVEEHDGCYDNLKQVIQRRWSHVPIDNCEGPIENNTSKIYLINAGTDEAIQKIDQIEGLGRSIFFFDPLLYVEWDVIDKVARNKINEYYKTGTEFIIFLFTSDWFLGRDEFSPLPTTKDERSWGSGERQTVEYTNKLFGHDNWQNYLLTDSSIDERERTMVSLYCINLFNWFRYVLPLPFRPKQGQLYHLFFCSNYEVGINLTKGYFQAKTDNPRYSPSNPIAYANFKRLHPGVCMGVRHPKKPLEWKILWKVIKGHQFGVCDPWCRDFIKDEPDPHVRTKVLEWLEHEAYLQRLHITNPIWEEHYQRYILDWNKVMSNLKIDRPMPLIPIEPSE